MRDNVFHLSFLVWITSVITFSKSIYLKIDTSITKSLDRSLKEHLERVERL